MKQKRTEPAPGDGIRSLRSTMLFRAVNFELYAKQNKAVMLFGVVAIFACSGYLLYMKCTYDDTPYYKALQEDGKIVFKKKLSRWES